MEIFVKEMENILHVLEICKRLEKFFYKNTRLRISAKPG